MAYSYRFVEDLCFTDVGFEVEADTVEELFVASALATEAVMADVGKIRPVVKRDIEIKAEGLDMLLFSFLEELIFLKDSEGLLFSRFDIMVKDSSLKGRIYGQPIGEYEGELGRDVKAVTLHQFEVKRRDGRFYARVVLDI